MFPFFSFFLSGDRGSRGRYDSPQSVLKPAAQARPSARVSALLSSARQHGDCLEVKREYYQNCSVLGCVIQCSQSAAHLYEQFLQVQQIGFVTLVPLRRA